MTICSTSYCTSPVFYLKQYGQTTMQYFFYISSIYYTNTTENMCKVIFHTYSAPLLYRPSLMVVPQYFATLAYITMVHCTYICQQLLTMTRLFLYMAYYMYYFWSIQYKRHMVSLDGSNCTFWL